MPFVCSPRSLTAIRIVDWLLGSEISKVVYPVLGNLNRPITSYGKEAISEAVIAVYRWARKQKHKFTVALINDILQSICAEKRRYENRAMNKKKREAGIVIPVGRPPKPGRIQAPKVQSHPGKSTTDKVCFFIQYHWTCYH